MSEWERIQPAEQHAQTKPDLGKIFMDELMSIPSDYLHAFTKRPVLSTVEALFLDPIAPLVHEKLVKEPARRMKK